jgi:hypothetical protein
MMQGGLGVEKSWMGIREGCISGNIGFMGGGWGGVVG